MNRAPRRRIRMLLAAALLLMPQAGARASDKASEIEIVGTPVAENPNYFRWTITNKSRASIVRFSAPRFMEELVVPPDGWNGEITKSATDNSRGVQFTVAESKAAIQPGQSLVFQIQDMRPMRTGRTKAPQNVVIGLLDGSEVTIPNVLCPAGESPLVRNLNLIALGAMFAIFLLVQAIRTRRRKASASGNSTIP